MSEGPERARVQWGTIVGAVLALPGLFVIASFLLSRAATRAADCTFSGQGFLRAHCPSTVLGTLAAVMHETVNQTVYFSFVGIGLVPPFYTVVFVLAAGSGLLGMAIEGRRTLGPGTRLKGLAAILGLVVLAGVLARVLAG